MTSPDLAAIQRALAKHLRVALPLEQQHRADELTAFIAALPPDRADATLRPAYPDLAPLLTPLIRVGGGYAFQHRLRRDYLGALSDADIADLAAHARR